MGLHLMAVTWDLHLLVVILEVAFGLGMVIFVHELGHFAVAKWCGVKCEKFYLGFDIYGLKLFKKQWGETEYGIGILPLGGYVKMLGQDDNPSRAAQERERSTLSPAVTDRAVASSSAPALDPRSYMAKSVPQRMAIISAGVIMNVIFAFLMAIAAYSLGVRDTACGISAVLPGEPAWKANLQPGDMFVQIDNSGDRPLRFRDLMAAVALGDIENGVEFQIQREGVEKPFWVNVKPDPNKNRLRPTIGVVPPRTTTLAAPKAVVEGTPAASVEGFQPGDKIVAISGTPINTFADFQREVERHAGQTLAFTVEHPSKGAKEGDAVTIATIEVPARPMRTLGLVMKLGKITAVQADSPAAQADLRAGDFITAIDGQPPSDPMRLPDAMRSRAGQTVKVTVLRAGPGGQDEELEKQVTLREPAWPEETEVPGGPLSVPAMGITVRVLNTINAIDKDSPAAAAQLTLDGQPASVPVFATGDEIVKAEFLPPKKSDQKEADNKAVQKIEMAGDPVEFGAEKPNWPFFHTRLQWLPTGTKIRLTLSDGRTATLEPADAGEWFYPDRGLITTVMTTTTRATNASEAVALGWQETKDSVLQVYSFIRKIGSQISPLGLGGPKTIAEAAGAAAYEGVAQLLLFLTMLSANLAVINFLPIPLLDGGHMVFLLLEGLFRRPVSEKVVVAFHYAGFVFIISLMLFVLGLDFGIISRHQ